MADLSVIILSYNTKEITRQCISSLQIAIANCPPRKIEIIVADNASSDGSREMLSEFPVKKIFLEKNLGFGAANNRALKQASGKYILYLNSDVIHENVDYNAILSYLDDHPDVGGLTVKVLLRDKKSIDPASHRGFPTLWRSFTYFSGLERTLGSIPILSRVFGGYHLLHENLEVLHEIDSPSGAFFISRSSLLRELGGFDEAFFMYGEDLDLAYRIKQKGYRIMWYPEYSVIHLKYSSGIKNNNSAIKKRIKKCFYDSMLIFYKKHYARFHNPIVNSLVTAVIRLQASRV
ncbi:MAG: glycosyltransferase family 2 protein [Patescibacteria group bacterium]|nr:glycosyltransferase family 2 protein [Patescibacteria group bacterium]